MARIIGIDYGSKRTGIAVTDPLQIIASGLETVPTSQLWEWIAKYFEEEEIEAVILGEPLHKDDTPTNIHHLVIGLSRKIKKQYPHLEVILWDESYTSVAAKQVIMQSGAKKKKRQNKELVDTISAALILKDYMENNKW